MFTFVRDGGTIRGTAKYLNEGIARQVQEKKKQRWRWRRRSGVVDVEAWTEVPMVQWGVDGGMGRLF